jgi:hypothetical protein
MIFWIFIIVYLCVAYFSVFNCNSVEEEMIINTFDNQTTTQTLSYTINPIERNN